MKKFIICILSLLIMISLVSSREVVLAEELENMTADSYVVVDSNGKILCEKNMEEKHEVASICKLMTTLITLEYIDNGVISLEDKFVASTYASDAEGSQAFLDAGSEYSVGELLKSVIVASANDSAIVLAEGISGNERNFVKLMNERAQELGMKNTKYANSTGLPAMEQYSTAIDTAKLLNEVSKYPIYQEDCRIWMDSLTHPSGRVTELVNTNRLIKYYNYCKTGKTGFTDEAGYCLASTSSKDNLDVTCVVLGCDSPSSRFSESIELYNWTYANFTNEKVLSCTDCEEIRIKVLRGKEDSLVVKPKSDYYLTRSKVGDKEYEIKYILPENVCAPINAGEVVGNALIIVEGNVIGEIPLVVDTQVDGQTYKDILNKITNKFALVN